MQGARVQPLVRELDPATKSLHAATKKKILPAATKDPAHGNEDPAGHS